MNLYLPTHRKSTNFATADRPRCMLRDENYARQSRQFRGYDYGTDEYEQTQWHWNMNHQPNGDALIHGNGKKSHPKSKQAFNSSRSHSSSSGFQSFFRWFKKDEKPRVVDDIAYPRDVTSSTDTLEFESKKRYPKNTRRKHKVYDSNDTLSPPSSPRFSRTFSQSSSCDSVFSTASSFAFVPPVKYLSNRNQRQPEPSLTDRSYTETYQRRVQARDQAREYDKRNEVTLRKKYQLYAESSDAESSHPKRYQDFSLPTRKINLPDSAKLHDLSLTKHRRTSSDTSKDKRAGAYVHVKGKRKAPPPPDLRANPHTLSPKSSLGRKKRPAPPPPIRSFSKNIEAATSSSTSLLEDKEIKALIEGTSRGLSPHFSTSSIPVDMERKSYVSPYLKIREDRKLTDEQKRILIEQVTKNTRKNDEIRASSELSQSSKGSTSDMFTIERGQLVYQGNESPKLPHKEEKIVAPSSPISPRPWFKRHSGSNKESNQSSLKIIEKKKSKNDEKDLPELGYSRNSFFGNASRFNIFARIGEDSKKKERDAEKRKSQIGIPNISELDREAAEIIQKSHEMNQSGRKMSGSEILMLRSQVNQVKDASNDDERPRSAKDLINKFEADTSHINRITLNTSYIGRREFFGDMSQVEKTEAAEKKVEKEPEPTKSKLPQLIKETNGIRKSNDLMGLWKCPYCTMENPNWKIICEACEKIKPYEKRFLPNGDLAKSKELPPKVPQNEPRIDENLWDLKTEAILKYFNPPTQISNGLAKSPSETAVMKTVKQSASPSRIPGSPQMNFRRNLFKSSSENHDSIDVIHEEASDVIVKQTPSTAGMSQETKFEKTNGFRIKSPDLNEIRSARLAKFNLITNLKKNLFEDENSNTNQKKSPEKKFPDKLDFSDPVALEQEKERLREKIRAMNAKALNEKYPVLRKIPEKVEDRRDKVNSSPGPLAPPRSPRNNSEQSSRLGAIRKTFKNPFETRRGSSDKEKNDDKILNQESEEKTERISISVQTKIDPKEISIVVPTTVNAIAKTEIIPKVTPQLTTKQQEEVEVISDQLKSKDGIETFKATLRSKSINKTNTLAINKILRNLELAISDGKYDDAAQLATDLAKMKVSLSVTRQKDRPKSAIEPNLKHIRVNLTVKDGTKEITTAFRDISLLMTLNELKKRVEKEFKIPIDSQKMLLNNVLIDGEKSFEDFGVSTDEVQVKVIREAPVKSKAVLGNNLSRQDSESDDETQNEKVGIIEGAVGGAINPQAKLKIEEDGWECPLCTLINTPNRPGCLACSTTRPLSYKVPSQFQEIEYKLKVNEDLRTFFEMDKVEKVEIRPPSQKKNDLNRQSANRKSSDIFNILVDEKRQVAVESTSLDASLPNLVISSPNITKNKYRGVDNFNPTSKSYVFTRIPDVRKPVITSVVYKAPIAKDSKPNHNHYQQLVSLDLSDIAPNLEKFECSICFMEIEPKAGAVLRECLHWFCKLCLASHVKYSEEAEIKCPFMDDKYSCQSLIQEREIRSLVSKEEYEKHLARSIRQAEHKIENTYHCKTPNCRGWCIFEDTSNIFRCPVCTIVNCLTCRAVHDGINCKQYQDQLNNDANSESAKQTKQLLQDLIDKEEALNCPTCHIFLLKKWGCDWLKCSFCKTEICWVTRGPRWGPNGKGDVTAGCRCGVNGKKCSPKCNYCH